LGHGSDDRDQHAPKKIEALNDKRAVAVYAGSFNSAALCRGPEDSASGSTFELYIWGAGERGQIGNGELSTQMSPVKLPLQLDSAPRSVSFGLKHTALVTGILDATVLAPMVRLIHLRCCRGHRLGIAVHIWR